MHFTFSLWSSVRELPQSGETDHTGMVSVFLGRGGGRVRYFTVFEGKRIQTFPDDFRVSGGWGEAMRQIGNAVPVRLAELLGERLMQTLRQQPLHAEVGKRFSASS